MVLEKTKEKIREWRNKLQELRKGLSKKPETKGDEWAKAMGYPEEVAAAMRGEKKLIEPRERREKRVMELEEKRAKILAEAIKGKSNLIKKSVILLLVLILVFTAAWLFLLPRKTIISVWAITFLNQLKAGKDYIVCYFDMITIGQDPSICRIPVTESFENVLDISISTPSTASPGIKIATSVKFERLQDVDINLEMLEATLMNEKNERENRTKLSSVHPSDKCEISDTFVKCGEQGGSFGELNENNPSAIVSIWYEPLDCDNAPERIFQDYKIDYEISSVQRSVDVTVQKDGSVTSKREGKVIGPLSSNMEIEFMGIKDKGKVYRMDMIIKNNGDGFARIHSIKITQEYPAIGPITLDEDDCNIEKVIIEDTSFVLKPSLGVWVDPAEHTIVSCSIKIPELTEEYATFKLTPVLNYTYEKKLQSSMIRIRCPEEM